MVNVSNLNLKPSWYKQNSDKLKTEKVEEPENADEYPEDGTD